MDSKHCYDHLGLISAVDVIDVYSRQYILEKVFFLVVLQLYQLQKLAKKSLLNSLAREKAGIRQALCLCSQPRKHSE